MKKKILPVIAAFSFILVVIGFMILGKVIDKYTPTDERQDLAIQYHVTSDEEVAIDFLKSCDSKQWAERLLLRLMDRINGENDNLTILTIMVE